MASGCLICCQQPSWPSIVPVLITPHNLCHGFRLSDLLSTALLAINRPSAHHPTQSVSWLPVVWSVVNSPPGHQSSQCSSPHTICVIASGCLICCQQPSWPSIVLVFITPHNLFHGFRLSDLLSTALLAINRPSAHHPTQSVSWLPVVWSVVNSPPSHQSS